MKFSIFQSLAAMATAWILLASASVARADLLLEPYAGLETGSFTADFSTSSSLKYTAAGAHLGARVGIAVPLIFVALDYDYGSLTSTVEKPTGTTYEAGSLTRTSLFAEVGLKIPLLRAYLGYGLMNDWTFAKATGSDDLKFKGNAYKAGVGFSGLPFVVVWIDYMVSTFTKYSAGSTEVDLNTSNTFKSATASSLMLTVSLPFEI